MYLTAFRSSIYLGQIFIVPIKTYKKRGGRKLRIFLIKHGGPQANGRMIESAKFLKKFVNLSNIFLLSSPNKVAYVSAMIIKKELKLKKGRVKKKKSLEVIKNYHGSKNHQLMEFLICFAADHYDSDADLIVVSHEGLIRKTLDAFDDIYIPSETKCKTTIERGSIHVVNTRSERVVKLFP